MGRMILGRAIKYVITIEPSSNMGFLVQIGCGKFVADSKVSLISQLECYLDNPEMYEKEYAKELGGGPPETIVDESETITLSDAPGPTVERAPVDDPGGV